MNKIIVNVTDLQGTVIDRFVVIDGNEPNSITLANLMREHVEKRYEVEDHFDVIR